MTKEEILAMKVGRDLDWQVCLQVFEGKTLGSLKHYSADISFAWQIKEKLKVGDNKTWFSFCEQVEELCGGDERVLYELNPEIICKAALLAVKVF